MKKTPKAQYGRLAFASETIRWTIRPQVDPHEASQPVEVEHDDHSGHDRPAGGDADRPEAEQHDDDPDEALAGLADDVRVGQVFHALGRLEARLQRLRDLDEDRRRGREIENDLRVVAPADELAVDDRADDQQRRQDDPQHERRADQPRSGVRSNDALADEVVPRPEPEHDPEDPRDRPGGHDRAQPRRPERARDDQRPGERHRPGDQLRAREDGDVPPHLRPLRGERGRRGGQRVGRSLARSGPGQARFSGPRVFRRRSSSAQPLQS